MAMSDKNVRNSLPVLEGGNFGNWLFRVLAAMDEHQCRETVSSEKDEAIKKFKDEFAFMKADSKAKNLIIQSLQDKHIEYIREAQTAKEMIENLKKIFERKSVLSSLYLRKQLIQLKCKKGQKLEEHFHNFDKIIRDLETSGKKFDEADKVCHLLLSMADSYQPTITALETTNIELTLDYTKSKLLDAELKMADETAFQSSGNCSFTGEAVKCYTCGKTGHFARNCRGRNHRGITRGRRARGKSNFQGRPESNITSEKTENFSFIAYASSATEDNEMITFVVDSGSTYNMIDERYSKFMKDIQTIEVIHIRVANGNTIQINKKGKLMLKTKEGITVTIECLIGNNLSHNLISVRKLNIAGSTVTFKKNIVIINTPSGQIQGKCNGSLFTIDLNIIQGNAMTAENSNLWHQRMAHLNHAGMRILGLSISNAKCDICHRAKGTRIPFSEVCHPKSKEIGELIYCDIGGPITPLTANGERFYLTIIDDFSHFTEVYILKYKSEAKKYIINYVNRMKNRRINIQKIRTDNGGEFVDRELKEFCEKEGISQEFTCPYTPQQNGVAERMNRTLCDRIRALLIQSNLPKYLWNEALRCATYALNRSPTQALRGDTPASIFLGKTNLKNMKVFGSKAWYTNLPKQGKLEPRATEARMVGYSGNGYRLWNPQSNEIVISRDVKFDESKYKYEEEISTETTKEVILYDTEDENIQQQQEVTETQKEPERSIQKNAQEKESIENENVEVNKRNRKLPAKLSDYEMYLAYALISEEDPITYEEAIEKDHEWKDAISKEIKSLEEQNTWIETKLPEGKKAISTKWVFKTKSDGTRKARLVARGFQQETYDNVYSPVAKISTIRLGLSHALNRDLSIRQLDIPSAFLNGQLDSEVYIKVPKGVKVTDNEKVLKLQKSLYGLKESPRCWNDKMNSFCESINMKRSKYDVCLYTRENLWLILFVDDILLFGNLENIEETVQLLKQEFKAKDLGNISTFLGIDIERKENTIKLSQKKFIDSLIERYSMSECKEASTPMEVGFNTEKGPVIDVPYRELVGSLIYLSLSTRPDITYATSYLSRYLDKPTEILWKAGKRIIRYLKGTKDMKLTFKKNEDSNLCISAFTDADWAGDKHDRKSTSGMAVYHGYNLISWSSKKQQTVALSTAEAEYVAAAVCTSEMLFIKGLVSEFEEGYKAVIYVDNQSAIKMMLNYENTRRSKHIDIRVHFVKDIIAKKLVQIHYVKSEDNIADIMTKSLCGEKFVFFRKKLCILC